MGIYEKQCYDANSARAQMCMEQEQVPRVQGEPLGNNDQVEPTLPQFVSTLQSTRDP